MSDRKYVLELTAEELEYLAPAAPPGAEHAVAQAADKKLRSARERARADRDADDLHLPWHVQRIENTPYRPIFRFWMGEQYTEFRSERQAKLMSAAPELLEAVQAANEYMTGRSGHGCMCRCAVIDGHTAACPIVRALHKVESGVTEPTDG